MHQCADRSATASRSCYTLTVGKTDTLMHCQSIRRDFCAEGDKVPYLKLHKPDSEQQTYSEVSCDIVPIRTACIKYHTHESHEVTCTV